MKSVRFRVTGRVQGVGFRNYAAFTADDLGVSGEVWNTRDGAVEGYAQGDEVDRFIELLRKGPGYVDSVTTDPTEPREQDGFVVTYTR